MEEKILRIPSISCSHCVMTIKNELMDFPGVQAVEGNAAAKTIIVRWNPPADWSAIEKTLADIGYPPEE